MTIDAPLAPVSPGVLDRWRWRRHVGTPARGGRASTETCETTADEVERWTADQDVRELAGLAVLAVVAIGVMLLLPAAVDVALRAPVVAAVAVVVLAVGAWAWRRRGRSSPSAG